MTEEAHDAAHHCLLDALACAFQSLQHPACTRLLGPVVPGATMTFGARVPGTSFQLDPVQAAFNLGTMIGWLDQQDAAFATRHGHLADTLPAVLSVADYQARKALAEGRTPATVRDVLSALLAAHARTQVETDAERHAMSAGADRSHAIEVASATAVTALLGGTLGQIARARELATRDLRPGLLDIARRPPWWLGDANARGVRLALLAMAEGGAAVDPTVAGPPSNGPLRLVHEATATLVQERFLAAVALHFPPVQARKIQSALLDRSRLESLPINELVSLTVRN
jgi:2-methylcitrate dehydratase